MEVSRVGVLGLYQRPLSGPDSLKQTPCREPRSLSHFQQNATAHITHRLRSFELGGGAGVSAWLGLLTFVGRPGDGCAVPAALVTVVSRLAQLVELERDPLPG
jgi:hypothetical protein